MSSVVVAGAGAAGLLCAGLLHAAGREVTVIERLPAPGGQEPEADSRRLARRLEKRGVTFELGTLVVSWEAGQLVTLGVAGSRRREADALVVATGMRPPTRGELGIAGDRPGGVLPGSAMAHLLEVGLLPGHRPAIVGSGERAVHCADLLARGGVREVTFVAARPPAVERLPVPTRVFAPYRVESVRGRMRVAGLTIVALDSGRRLDITADALVLADGERPMRNIEGAIDAAPGAHFCQGEDESAAAIAERTAASVLAAPSGASAAFPKHGTEKETTNLCRP